MTLINHEKENETRYETPPHSYSPTCVCICEKRLYTKGTIKSIRRDYRFE